MAITHDIWATVLAKTQVQMQQLSTRFQLNNFEDTYGWLQILIALLTVTVASICILLSSPGVIGAILNVS
jgi:hypothetical protein